MGEWREVRIDDFAHLSKGISYKSEDYCDEDEGAIFITLKCIAKSGGFSHRGIKYFRGKVPESGRLKPGDLLIANTDLTRDGDIVGCPVSMPQLGSDKEVAMSMDLSRIDLISNEVDKKFLFYRLMMPDARKFMKDNSSGSTVLHLKTSSVGQLEFKMPVLKEEQSKISQVLSAIDQAITHTEALIAKYQRIKTGLMQDLLTRGIDEHGNLRTEATHQFKDSSLGRIPIEWDVHELQEVAMIIDPNPSHRYPPTSDIGVPIASTENFIGENGFALSLSERVPFYVFEQQDYRCKYNKDDVVFARKGRLGFARPYGDEKKVFSHTVVIFKPRDARLNPRYLLWLVRFRDFFEQIGKRMNSNSGVPTLGIEFLGFIPVRVPEPEEHTRISSNLDYLENRLEEEQQNLAKIQRVKTGLMQDLLTGTVSVEPLLTP